MKFITLILCMLLLCSSIGIAEEMNEENKAWKALAGGALFLIGGVMWHSGQTLGVPVMVLGAVVLMANPSPEVANEN